ncbi:MAG: tryptophan synthase subunit alpha [Candidatus Aureabacteria bacterium]|nr:tryptophan synthase subunit alpha [Candidatus Auribacterota bacterium]
MKNRIDERFARLAREGRKGFIAYLTAGDPSPAATAPLVDAIEAAGADIVELGVPFSDPLADGVVNQRSAERALRRGVNLATVLEIVRRIRTRSEIPIVLFTYLNPVVAYGFERFAAHAQRAGVDGVLALDLPLEEAGRYRRILDARGIRSIALIAPTTPPERVRRIARHARGFIYYVSRTGVTGEQRQIAFDLARHVRTIRQVTTLPIAVGFGISTPAHVKEASRIADAVVVGSAIVKEIERCRRPAALPAILGRRVRQLSAPLRSR